MKIIREDARVNLPTKRMGDGGFDLQAAIEATLTIPPMQSAIVSTGLKVWLENPKLVGFILPRSKTGAKEGIILANSVGVLDSNYQGLLSLAVWNRNTDKDIVIRPMDKLAQLVVINLASVEYTLVDDFGDVSERGETGINCEDVRKIA